MNSPQLVAHWQLNGDARDAHGDSDGTAHQLTFGPGPDGAPNGAAVFNGVDSHVTVPDAAALHLEQQDFSFALWLKCADPMDSVFGDVVSKFDPVRRCGLNLYVAGSAPAYRSMADTRHVHFGIDDGYVSDWQDCGKPWPSNSLVSCLITYAGDLYCGTVDADAPMDAGHVFRYAGGTRWLDCGRISDDPKHLSVQSMIVHRGRLYAGASVWDWYKILGHVAGFEPSPARVFRYEGGTRWHDLGQVGDGTTALCMASFDGDLYVGLDARGGGKCFKHDGSTWIDCGAPDGDRLECLQVLGGSLYAATRGPIYRYEGGRQWTCIGDHPHGIAQIHSMAVAFGKLWAGTWPQGYALRYEGDGRWTIAGRLGLPQGLAEINEVMDLTVYNGKLYAGVIPKAQVYRYESDGHWTLLTSLAGRPDWNEDELPTWCRITNLASFRGRLYAATGACVGRAGDIDPDQTLGRVYAFQAGHVVSYEHDLGGDWHHLVALRRGRRLDLYLNGRRCASSIAPPGRTFILSNTEPLYIGRGAHAGFRGAIADLRLYHGALSQPEIMQLASTPGPGGQ